MRQRFKTYPLKTAIRAAAIGTVLVSGWLPATAGAEEAKKKEGMPWSKHN